MKANTKFRLTLIVGLALFVGLTVVVLAGTFTPIAVTDQTPTAPLVNPVPSAFQPRYISGFGSDDSFTVFFEDRDQGNTIYYASTTSGPTGFPASASATDIVDTHFVVKDWPINVGGTDYDYRAWGSVDNTPNHHFYVSNNLTNWTVVSTFTIPTLGFAGARGPVYYGFHDVILLNGTYYAFAESNQGQTMLVRSLNGDDVWEAFDKVGGTLAADGPLQLPESGTPSGSFVNLGYDRGYGKIHVRGNDSGFYLAVNTAAKPSMAPPALEAAFINPANWTWHDGSTGLPTTPILSATGEHDLRECWVVPNTDPDADWVIIYDADFGAVDGGKALGYATLTPPPAPPVHNVTQGTYYDVIQVAIDAANSGDTINVEPGTYAESVVIDVDNLTLVGDATTRPTITGGVKLDTDLAGLTFKNFYVKGSVSGETSVVRMFGAVTDLTVDNCVFDGENVSSRHGFSGGQLEGDVTVTNSEFKNILGWALFDSRSGTGGDGSAMGTVTFAGNSIHDSNGSVVFRGLSTDPTDLVNVYDNTWNNIGGNGGETGDHWAALEVNRAEVVNLYGNTVRDVSENTWGEGEAFQLWSIGTLDVYHNALLDNYQGIWVASVGGSPIPGGSIHHNSISGNSDYGLQVGDDGAGGVLDAENNWWGDATGPNDPSGGDEAGPGTCFDPSTMSNTDGTGDSVSDLYADYCPWLACPAALWVEPVEEAYLIDDTFDVVINVRSVEPAYGAQVTFTYDPGKLAIQSHTVGDFGGSGPQVVFNEDPAGTVLIGVSRISPETHFLGEGVLMTINFKAIGAGDSGLQLSSAILADSDAIQITPVCLDDGLIHVLGAGTGVMAGTVELQGRPGDWDGAAITLTHEDWPKYTYTLNVTNLDGTWSQANMAPGNYTVEVEMARYLDAKKTGQAVTDGNTTTLNQVKLLGGDAVENDEIVMTDLTLIGGQFGLTSGDPGWDARADINDDDAVNILDLVLAGGNYTKTSPVPWP